MKKKSGIRIFLVAFVTLLFSLQACAQEYSEKETRELDIGGKKKVLIIENIFGNIRIEEYTGNKGLLEIEETIVAESKAIYEKAKKELSVKTEYNGDTILVYIDAPFIAIKKKNGEISYNFDRIDEDYRFRINFTAKIPKETEILVSTINDGEITAQGISGTIKARNVNGGIKLKNAGGQTSLSTVNGNIEVDFNKNPQQNCKFKTINGNIDIFCDKNLSADISYKSMNGEFYTNYTVSALEPEILKETIKMEGSTFYKLGHKPQFRIGAGKIKMMFETLNGDMTIKYKE